MTDRAKNESFHPIIIGDKLFDEGLTLRDYFAGQALAGILNFEPGSYEVADEIAAAAAKSSYSIADAMLREREKDPRP